MAGVNHSAFDNIKRGFVEAGQFDASVFDAPTPAAAVAAPETSEFWEPATAPSTEQEKQFCTVVGERFVKQFGEALPNKYVVNKETKQTRTQVNIPNGLYGHRSDLYSDLKERELVHNLGESTFYRWLNKFFYFVCWRKWSPFAKCDICVELKQRLFGAKAGCEEGYLDKLKRKLAAHRAVISMSRWRMAFRVLLALVFPSWCLHISMDGMDSAKTWSPHVTTNVMASKGLSDTGRPLKTKLVGVLADKRWFQGYVTYPHYKEGANLSVTILHQALLKHVEWEGSLPPVLFLQMDNCGRDNKNHTMIAYLAYLVQTGRVQQVYLDFLPVGEPSATVVPHSG